MRPSEILKEAFWNLQARRIHIQPCHTTRASSLGHECERFLVYEQTQYEMRALHTPELQCIFDLGAELETYVLRKIEEMGVGIYQRQRDYFDRRYNLSGHMDVKLQVPGIEKPVLAEVKGLNPFTAGTIRSAEDIRDHKQAWVRKYYAQLQVYMLLDNTDMGVFILMDKTSGQLNFIDCQLDYSFAEELLRRAERVRDHVKAGTLPERHVTGDCQRCPFLHVCKPNVSYGDGVEFWDSAEMEAMLARRAELEVAAKEFAQLDKAIKEQAPKKPELLCGDFVLQGKEVERKGYEVKPSKFWQWSIRRIVKEARNATGKNEAA